MSGSGSNGWMSLIFRIFARWFPRGLLVHTQFPPLAVPGNLRYHLNFMEFYVGIFVFGIYRNISIAIHLFPDKHLEGPGEFI